MTALDVSPVSHTISSQHIAAAPAAKFLRPGARSGGLSDNYGEQHREEPRELRELSGRRNKEHLRPGNHIASFPKKRNLQKKGPQSHKFHLCRVLLNSSGKSGRVGTTNHLDNLAVLEDEEGGHGGDSVVGSNLRQLVDVDLVELDALVLLAQLLKVGGDSLARATPGCEEIDEDGLLGLENICLELIHTMQQDYVNELPAGEKIATRAEGRRGEYTYEEIN